VAASEECVMKQPENAACYYYRAMNTGVYYAAHVAGYQDGIKSMINDCKKVISLDEKFDHAGAYRTLGKIYTDMPEITLTRNGIRRDLDLAIKYLEKAVQIDPSYPENFIYLANALFEAGKRDEAFRSLSTADSLVPMWKNHPDYSYWRKLNKDLSNKLR
jgi:tetratricopeptide (TPR) repeat protein